MIAAIEILGSDSTRSHASPSFDTCSRISSGPWSTISLMSAPAAKSLGPPPHDDRADVVARAGLFEGGEQLDRELERDRVGGRAVDADDPDAVVHLEAHEVRHRAAPYQSLSEVFAASARSPSTNGVVVTPNAAAASGASATDAAAKISVAREEIGIARSSVSRSAAAIGSR